MSSSSHVSFSMHRIPDAPLAFSRSHALSQGCTRQNTRDVSHIMLAWVFIACALLLWLLGDADSYGQSVGELGVCTDPIFHPLLDLQSVIGMKKLCALLRQCCGMVLALA